MTTESNGVSSKQLACAALTLYGLRYVPRNLEIPPHYLTAIYANHARKGNRLIIDSIPEEPRGWTDVTWPVLKIVREAYNCWNYVFDEPVIAAGLLIEKAVRGDFDSNVRQAEQNLTTLKQQNIVYDEQIKRLAPVANLMLQIIQKAKNEEALLSLENENSQFELSLREKEIQNITETLQQIKIEDASQALEKVGKFVQGKLTNPSFVKDLKLTIQRLEKIETTSQEAQCHLTSARDILAQKTSRLADLMSRCQELRMEESQIYRDLEPKARRLLEQTKPSKPFSQPTETHVQPPESVTS